MDSLETFLYAGSKDLESLVRLQRIIIFYFCIYATREAQKTAPGPLDFRLGIGHYHDLLLLPGIS